MRERANTSGGISLLELSIVVFLMAVLLGFSMPRFSSLFDSQLLKEARRIAVLLHRLRIEAILKGENYKIVFDTKKSEYSVFTASPQNPREYTPHEKYSKPIQLKSPVEFLKVTKDEDEEGRSESRFGFNELEFDKIFGLSYEFRVDSSGFIDLFTIRLKDREHSISMSVVNIMGKIEIGDEAPL
jgi:Tfp pilus assembly protein FimT